MFEDLELNLDNNVIWKQVFPHWEHRIQLPHGAKILACGQDPDSGNPAIWVEVNPERYMVERCFKIFPTGTPTNGSYVGTAFCGSYVWHIYE